MSQPLSDFIVHTLKENLVVLYAQIHRGGELIDEYSRLPKTRLHMYSVSKGFVSCAAGIAVGEGLLSLDERICDIFPEYVPDEPGEYLLKITVRHLLTMTSGLESSLFFCDWPERYTTKDWIAHFFSARFIYEPGTKWLYSNFNTYMVSCAIERRAGQNLLEYLRYRLFEPIGIGNPDWMRCPNGHVQGASGLYLTIDELSRYGELIKNFGSYGGRQIVPENYMRDATAHHADMNGSEPWHRCGYGYQFIRSPEEGAFRSEGRYGQFCLAFPAQDAVVTVMSLEENEVRIARHLWQDIVPAIVTGDAIHH